MQSSFTHRKEKKKLVGVSFVSKIMNWHSLKTDSKSVVIDIFFVGVSWVLPRLIKALLG